MLQKAIDAVAEFHAAKEIDFKQDLAPMRGTDSAFEFVHNAVKQMRESSRRALHLFNKMCEISAHQLKASRFASEHHKPNHVAPDYRFLRISLIMEEVAELCEALMSGDEIEAMDGAADSIYVILGTAVTYDLPFSEAFEEVHRSNMSKTQKGGQARLHDKGALYVPPDLQRVLKEYRDARLQKCG